MNRGPARHRARVPRLERAARFTWRATVAVQLAIMGVAAAQVTAAWTGRVIPAWAITVYAVLIIAYGLEVLHRGRPPGPPVVAELDGDRKGGHR